MVQATAILDTNIVSYLLKKDPRIDAYEKHIRGRILATTFVTVGELYYGAQKAKWGPKRIRQIEATLRTFLVLPYDVDIARYYGNVVADREGIGRPISQNDAWIAACALRHDLDLITHNARDFESISALRLITEASTT